MEFMKNDHHQETTPSSPSSVAVADHRRKTYTVMTSTGKPLKIRFVFGKSSKNKPAAAAGVPTQDHDQESVLEADAKREIKAKEVIIDKQQQQIIQEKDHKKAAATKTMKDHPREAAKQVKVKDHQTTMITVKQSIRAADDQYYSAPNKKQQIIKAHDHHQEAAKQVKLRDYQTTMITAKKTIRATDDQDYSAPLPSYQIKLEGSKRKLHGSYLQLADAKKQRTIKVIDRLPPKSSSSSSRGGAAAATGSTSTSKARGGIRRVLSKKNNLHHGRPKLMLPTY